MNGFYFKVSSVFVGLVKALNPRLIIVSGTSNGAFNGEYLYFDHERRYLAETQIFASPNNGYKFSMYLI
jgi:hypothetical protein